MSIDKIAVEMNTSPDSISKEFNIYSLSIGGQMQTIEMCYRLYGHATTYMERKYKKYRLLVNTYFKTGRTE